MSEVHHQPCPFVDCGSSDAFSFNTEGKGYCHSCGSGYPSKKETFEWAAKRYPFTPRNTKPTQADYLEHRGLTSDTCRMYNIQTQMDDAGNPVRYAFKYPCGQVKYRSAYEKKFWLKEKEKPLLSLFNPGFNAGTSTRVYITESEVDAASLYQIIDDGKGRGYPVVSLPSASVSDAFLKKNHSYLDSFKEIVYAGELDDAGRSAAEKLYSLYPHKFFYVPLTKHKDANDFLTKGDGEELKWAALKPQRYTPPNFFVGEKVVEHWIRTESPYKYTPTGHSGLDNKIRGLVKGGLTFIKAQSGQGKCLHPDTLVILFDGQQRKVKDIREGDFLLGPDGNKRTVLSTCTGSEEMFRVVPVKGEPWVCNRSHILHVKNVKQQMENISVDNYLSLSPAKQKTLKQVRSREVSFEGERVLPFDPYLIGLWLADGDRNKAQWCLGNKKEGCRDYLLGWANDNGYSVWKYKEKGACYSYHLHQNGKRGLGRSALANYLLSECVVDGEKVVPFVYQTASVADRRKLLAGYLDGDGYKTYNNFDAVSKDVGLSNDIAFIARSLGLAAYQKECVKGIKSTGFEGKYIRTSISGDTTALPFLRHKVQPRKQIKCVRTTGFTVESLGEGTYCGFELDGDGLFLLGDFTITHNTSLIRYLEIGVLNSSDDTTVGLLHMEESKSTTYRSMASYQLGVNVNTKEDAEVNGITEERVILAAKQATKGERTIIFEMRSEDDPLDLLTHVRLGATVYGVTHFFIDHVQRLSYLSKKGVEDATGVLTTLASRMAQLAKELNICVVFVSQVNDDGRTKYASSLQEEALVVIALERDPQAEDERERNTTKFVVEKNRPFSRTGDAGSVYYDVDTTMLSEIHFDV